MAKNHLIKTTAATALLISAQVPAGTIEPELLAAIEGLSPGDFVDVIVRCTGPVDPAEFHDPDLAARREGMIRALQNRSQACYRSLANKLERTSPEPPVELWIANSVAATVPVAELNGLANRAGVESVGLDAEIRLPEPALSGSAAAVAGDPEWNLNTIGAPDLWALGHDGAGRVIASMDTGVDYNHPDIGPRWRGGANSWFDPNGEHATPYDANGHGTWTMSLLVGGDAGGTAIGVAPGAQWIAVKIFKDNDRSRLSKIHEGIQWLFDPDGHPATDDAPDVINNSWYLDHTVDTCDGEFTADIALLKAAEIAVVFSAGNTGPADASSVSPANNPGSLAVGATDQLGYVAGLSARGPSACDGGIYPQLSAPGIGVRTADRTFGGIFPDSYTAVSGTSFAAPHVSGGFALLMGAFGGATVSQVESALEASALDLGEEGPDNEAGFGLLDLAAAYAWLEANTGSTEPGELQFSSAGYSIDEDAGAIQVTVIRSGGSAGVVTADYATADVTAIADEDYRASAGTLTFLDGETSRVLSVAILDDSAYETDEELSLTLSQATGGANLGYPNTAVVTILDDDPAPQPGSLQFSAASYSAAENDGGLTVTVMRSGGSDGDVTVNYATVAGTAAADEDYTTTSGTLSFADGQTTATFAVPVLDDAVYEGNEGFELALGNPGGGAGLGSRDTASVTIIDDEAPPPECTPEIKHDGIDQDCNGYDLTIDILTALYASKGDKLSVEATSDLGDAANLELVGFGPMKWSRKSETWSIDVPKVGGNPGTITVTGVEGAESAAVSE